MNGYGKSVPHIKYPPVSVSAIYGEWDFGVWFLSYPHVCIWSGTIPDSIWRLSGASPQSPFRLQRSSNLRNIILLIPQFHRNEIPAVHRGRSFTRALQGARLRDRHPILGGYETLLTPHVINKNFIAEGTVRHFSVTPELVTYPRPTLYGQMNSPTFIPYSEGIAYTQAHHDMGVTLRTHRFQFN